jgi:hypothetical protein
LENCQFDENWQPNQRQKRAKGLKEDSRSLEAGKDSICIYRYEAKKFIKDILFYQQSRLSEHPIQVQICSRAHVMAPTTKTVGKHQHDNWLKVWM